MALVTFKHVIMCHDVSLHLHHSSGNTLSDTTHLLLLRSFTNTFTSHCLINTDQLITSQIRLMYTLFSLLQSSDKIILEDNATILSKIPVDVFLIVSWLYSLSVFPSKSQQRDC